MFLVTFILIMFRFVSEFAYVLLFIIIFIIIPSTTSRGVRIWTLTSKAWELPITFELSS